MRSVIIVHPQFDRVWPFAADFLHEMWQEEGQVEFFRLHDDDERLPDQIVNEPEGVHRLILLNIYVTVPSLKAFSSLEEIAYSYDYSGVGALDYLEFPDHIRETGMEQPDATKVRAYLQEADIRLIEHRSEGFWGQSVAEFALGLTIASLRRIPQTYHESLTSLEGWEYEPPEGKGRPGARGHQFGDDVNFTNGTVAGKRVRIVGAGNIASRYASFVHMLGADVAAWDPFASEPSFHRAGSRREWFLEELVKDAQIFAPMVPQTKSTTGLVTKELINALPKGCLVVLATRAGICDMEALRKRVLADELSLAADVFDREPLPLDDPLLGRHNVVHTPHNAGRTIDANKAWAKMIIEKFSPRSNNR